MDECSCEVRTRASVLLAQEPPVGGRNSFTGIDLLHRLAVVDVPADLESAGDADRYSAVPSSDTQAVSTCFRPPALSTPGPVGAPVFGLRKRTTWSLATITSPSGVNSAPQAPFAITGDPGRRSGSVKIRTCPRPSTVTILASFGPNIPGTTGPMCASSMLRPPSTARTRTPRPGNEPGLPSPHRAGQRLWCLRLNRPHDRPWARLSMGFPSLAIASETRSPGFAWPTTGRRNTGNGRPRRPPAEPVHRRIRTSWQRACSLPIAIAREQAEPRKRPA